MPRVGNSTNPSRMNVMLLFFSIGTAVSIGLDHQVSSRLNSPVVAIAASAPRPSLAASQRVRVMLWVQASWKVPASTGGVTGDCHAPFCGSPGVRFPRATRRVIGPVGRSALRVFGLARFGDLVMAADSGAAGLVGDRADHRESGARRLALHSSWGVSAIWYSMVPGP
jgi:hypothetical protein